MKNGYRILFAMMLFVLAGAALLLAFTPDTVPLSFAGGEAGSFGSKYENLLFPLFAVLAGGAAAFGARKMRLVRPFEAVLQGFGIFFIIVFSIMGFVLICKAMAYDPSAITAPDAGRLCVIVPALLIAAAGLLKCERCLLPGKWSAVSGESREACLRFGFGTCLTAAALLFLDAIFLASWACVLTAAGVLLLALLTARTAYRRFVRSAPETQPE